MRKFFYGWRRIAMSLTIVVTLLLVFVSTPTAVSVDDAAVKALERTGAIVLFDDQLRITQVRISGTNVTDSDLKCLTQCGGLRSLVLDSPNLGNGCVEHLCKCTSLALIVIVRAKIDDEGCDAIKKAIPQCDIRTSLPPGFTF